MLNETFSVIFKQRGVRLDRFLCRMSFFFFLGVNFADRLSDPFVKIKVWRTANDSSPKSNKKKTVPTWKFQTQVIWECLAPVWNEM